MLEVGKSYNRRDLHDQFGGNRQSGIAPCANFPYVLLFSSPRGEEYGYRDGWVSGSEYLYTGEGQIGDMAMNRGNLAIKDHIANGKELLLFEREGKGSYEYLGKFKYLRHEERTGSDSKNQKRNVFVFRLQKIKP